MRTTMIIAALGLALTACSDDSKVTYYDKGTVKDIPTKPDNPITKKETGPTPDTGSKEGGMKLDGIVVTLDGTGPYNCTQISYCAKPCATDLTCVGKCSDRGCASAKTAFTSLSNCAIAKCLLSCVGGFTDPCLACAVKECPTETGACFSNKC